MISALRYLSPIIYNLRHRRVIELTKEFTIRQWWSTKALYRFGDERAHSLAKHATKNVPYYRELFHTLDIDPITMKLPEDWSRLPILDKDTLRTKYNDLIAETDHSKKARLNHSGGSTGKPVAFLSDLALFEIMAAHMRLIFSWAGWRPGEMILHLWGGGHKELPLTFWAYIKALLSGYLVLPVYSYGENVFEQWIEILNTYHPSIIYAYPSVAAEFSKWLKEKGYEPAGVKGVFCSGETLFLTHRKIIEEVFGCKVYNQYGSRETPCVACECPEGNMHLFVDLNRVEFLDHIENPDGPKRIIVTPLENYAQPLLRYDLGDLGNHKEGVCPCGRSYPLMDLTLGRNRDCLSTSDGRRIYPGFVTRFLDGENWVNNFQFRQVKIDLIELSLEVADYSNINDLINKLKIKLQPKLKDMMGSDVVLDIKLVGSIHRTTAGKHRFVINELEG